MMINTHLPRNAVAALALILAAAFPAHSSESTARFGATIEEALAANRVAMSYLRTGNLALAGIELEAMAAAWADVEAAFAEAPPEALGPVARGSTRLRSLGARIEAALLAVDDGDATAAATTLRPVRGAVYTMRRILGLTPLSDCIYDLNIAWAPLQAYRDHAPDLSDEAIQPQVIAAAVAYDTMISACDALAPAEIKADPEFRRLIDGARASLAQIPAAVASENPSQLYRWLIELRSIDRLLFFRFG